MAKKQKESEENNLSQNIDRIKEEYEILMKKYSLPSFKELNEEFDISKADFYPETILREIRKSMIAKLFSVLNFTELLLNPTNGSMFYMFLVKNINLSDKELLNKIFEKLGTIEIESFSLDITYNEKKEAEFIKNNFEEWNIIKKDLDKIVENLKLNWKKSSIKKEKSYFG